MNEGKKCLEKISVKSLINFNFLEYVDRFYISFEKGCAQKKYISTS